MAGTNGSQGDERESLTGTGRRLCMYVLTYVACARQIVSPCKNPSYFLAQKGKGSVLDIACGYWLGDVTVSHPSPKWYSRGGDVRLCICVSMCRFGKWLNPWRNSLVNVGRRWMLAISQVNTRATEPIHRSTRRLARRSRASLLGPASFESCSSSSSLCFWDSAMNWKKLFNSSRRQEATHWSTGAELTSSHAGAEHTQSLAAIAWYERAQGRSAQQTRHC